MTRCFDKSTKNWSSVASWVVGICAWYTIWHFFDLTWSQRPPSERVPYISGKLDFWWSIPQKITSNGYFGASDDQTIKIRKLFEKIGLQRLFRPVRLQRPLRPLRSMRLEWFLRPEKSLLRTSESSRFLNSIILGLISLYYDVLKIFLTESWKLMFNFNFSTFSVIGRWGPVTSKKFQLVYKFPLLRKPLSIRFCWIFQNIWSSQVFTLSQFLMVDPVIK